ncbi:MarR family winged helix-turn-helix transcriptional regulator [Nocardioides cavernaquae]|uniref:MarR family transcriptional regulator n=1 Tax=Nocardioides cavernaquae TaxID=2321396 RepID=A0A3A5H6K0_9ACTN|nr:MarR family transcriptional regulator [Nocardioides cavernaquae]RJS46182.1 MarR family transcriptional regulator [Nocardioides cavernaquae]
MSPSIEQLARTDAGLASALRTSVARLGRRLRNERDPGLELGLGSLSALGLLFREGPQTVGQLADRERVRPPSMTRTVGCLVDGGYAVRRKNETDGRQVVIEISEAGRVAVVRERGRRDAWLAQRLKELTPEERAVLRQAAPLLERIATA